MSDERPKNVRVSYSISATINLGNFENIKPEYEISADVPDGVNPAVVREKLKRIVDSWLEQDVIEHKRDAR